MSWVAWSAGQRFILAVEIWRGMGSSGFDFIQAGRDQRRFDVLRQIGTDSTRSQHAIGARIGLSAAAVNRYIHSLIAEGLVSVRGNTNKTTQYFLTPSGMHELGRLSRARTDSLLVHALEFSELIGDQMRAWIRDEMRGVVVAGANFNGGLVCVVAELVGLPVLALIDLDPAKQGDRFLGYVVQSPRVLEVSGWKPCGLMCLGASQAAEDQLRRLADEFGLSFAAL